MILGVMRAGLVLLAIGGLWVTGRVIMSPIVEVELPAAQPPARSRPVGAADPAIEQALLARAVERPVFRADRRAPSARYDPDRARTPASPPAPPTPKPPLAVSGIVWGDQPAAVVEGLPGVEGATVLWVGESAAGIRLVRIEGDRVVMRGMDTTWRLTVREPWQ